MGIFQIFVDPWSSTGVQKSLKKKPNNKKTESVNSFII